MKEFVLFSSCNELKLKTCASVYKTRNKENAEQILNLCHLMHEIFSKKNTSNSYHGVF